MSTAPESSPTAHEVVIARHGSRMASRSEVFLNYAHYGRPDAPIRMDYFVWVLRSAGRTIVVDTGYSREGARSRGREVLSDVPALLARIGVDCAAVPLVIITHAHYDHIGNLRAFPNARFLIARAEVDFWNSRNAGKPLFEHSVESEEIAYLNGLVEAGRVDFFAGECRPAAGVEVIEVGGHTPGQAVVLAQTSEGPVLLTSDAVHYYEELEADMPFTSVTDVVGMYDAFQTIRDLVASGRVRHLVSGHDPETLERFSPIPGLEGTAARIGAP
ncbi:N-acyl homoserine lactonase family protein [Leucobacter weissii]|uniref:N-acyl homoserine lactonase family protein n=1 Tax=Leucobacter weissii TaxID=1983706 RepID=A0A939MKM1_9MICO|nr:N-acyl homoserine lactonase family protein [Leucobacter weissii]MBO1902326.1 N-acyl homoserine lactonase family protein [Leucobacter weissii]